MTIGTAIVLSVAILCATFLGVLGIGVYTMKIKQETTNKLAQKILEKKNRQG